MILLTYLVHVDRLQHSQSKQLHTEHQLLWAHRRQRLWRHRSLDTHPMRTQQYVRTSFLHRDGGLPSFHHVLQGFGSELWKLREPQKGCSRDHHSCQRMLGVETGLARAWLGYLLISNVCCWGTSMWHPDNFRCSLSFRQPRTSAQLDGFLLLFLTNKGFWPHWH